MKIARRLMALLLALTLLCGNVITPVLATETAAEPEVTVDEVPETVTEEAEEPVDEEPDEAPVVETITNDAAAAQLLAADEAEEAGTTAENPILLYPYMFTFSEDQTSGTYTVTVPAATTHYFALYQAGGMEMTINDGEATTLTGNMMYPDTFSIANDGEAEAEYTITLSHPAGSQMNPEAIAELGWIDVTLAEGDYDGHYYTYTAPDAGTATFYIGSITEGVEADIVIYNENTYTQKSLIADGVDNFGLEVTIDVKAGDVLNIQVIAIEDADGNMYPAADITWYGGFTYLPGTVNNPIYPEFTWNEEYTEAKATVTVPVGTTYYACYGRDMLLSINGGEPIELVVEGMGMAPAVFTITNDGEAEADYTLVLAYKPGTYSNPEVLEYLGGYVIQAEGNDAGYYYTYTAESTGYLSAYVTYVTEGVAGDITLYNQNTNVQLNLMYDGVNGMVTMAVTEGDVIIINVSGMPADGGWGAPACEIGWSGTFSAELPGTQSNPIDITASLSWNETYSEASASVTVAAGATAYFAVNRVGGMLLTIDGGEPIVMTGDMWNPSVFFITNEGEEDAEYALTFAYAVGSQMNPEILDGMYGGYAVLEEGDTDGYYYSYTAEGTGYVNVGISWVTEGVEADVVLTNENTWQQVSVAADAVNGIVSMPVNEGDVITINAVAIPDASWIYPAVEIGWTGTFSTELPGGESDPISISSLLKWNDDQTEATATVTVPAGTTTYFSTTISGMTMTINGEDPVAVNGNWYVPYVFPITNDSEADAVYSLSFTYPVGSMENPEFLYYTRYIQTNLEEGDQDGYYYTYIAPEEGTVVLTGQAIEGVEYDVIITNNRNYAMAWMSDSTDYTVSMPVLPGDELNIQVVAAPDGNWNIPAATVVLYGSFIYPVGHMMNPDTLTLGTTTVDVKAESQGYFYNWTATGNGVLTFEMNTKKGWTYSVSNLSAGIYGDSMFSGEGTATGAVYVNEGDEIQIMVNTYDADNPWIAPAGSIKFTTALISTDLETVSGKTLTLNFYHPETGKKVAASKVNWKIEKTSVYSPDGELVNFDNASAYATLSAGKLKTLACGDHVQMIIKATLKDDESISANYYVEIYPASTKLSIWNGDEPVVGSWTWDMNGMTDEDDPWWELSAYSFPSNSKQAVVWSSSNKKIVTADDGVLRPVATYDKKTGEFTGFKTGTVTITAKTLDGTKKASFKLTVTKLASYVEIVSAGGQELVDIPWNWHYEWNEETQQEEQIVTEYRRGIYVDAGTKNLKLVADVDPNAAKKGVIWECYSEFAKISSSGALTVNANAKDNYTFTVRVYSKDYNVWDEMVVSVVNDVVAVNIYPDYDNPNFVWESETKGILNVSNATSENIPSLTLRGFVQDTDGGYIEDVANWKASGSKNINWEIVPYWETGEWVDGYWVPEYHYDMENQPEGSPTSYNVVVTPKWNASKNCCYTGSITLTGTSSDGKAKASYQVTVSSLVSSLEIQTKDGKNMGTVAAGEIWDSYATWNYETGVYEGAWYEGAVIYATAGQTVQLKAVTNSNAANKNVYWWAYSETFPDAVKMSNGKLTIGKDVPVEAIIWVEAQAKDRGYLYTKIPVIVTPRVTNVHISADFEGNGNERYVSNITKTWDYNDGDYIDLSHLNYPFDSSQEVKWTTSNSKIGYIEEITNEWGGTVTRLYLTGNKFGKLTITATAQDGSKVKSSFTLNVTRSVKDMLLKNADVAVGKSVNLAKVLTINYSDANCPGYATNQKVKWEITEGKEYATISTSGVLKAKKTVDGVSVAGKTVTVTVTSVSNPEVSVSCVVRIFALATGVNVTAPEKMYVGETKTLSAKNLPAEDHKNGGAMQAWTWNSSNSKVLSVDKDGNVTALKAGTAKITCTAADGSGKKATVTIKVEIAE